MFSVPIWNRSYTAFTRGPTGDLSMSSPSIKILYLWKFPTFSAPLTTLILAHTQQSWVWEIWVKIPAEESYAQSLSKTHVLGREFAPLMTFYDVQGAFKWCPNSQFGWKEGDAFDFGQKMEKVNFLANFSRHLKWCSQKFAKEIHFYSTIFLAKVKHLQFISIK